MIKEKLEDYWHSDLQFLSGNVDSEALEISHARDTEINLLQRESRRISNPFFK